MLPRRSARWRMRSRTRRHAITSTASSSTTARASWAWSPGRERCLRQERRCHAPGWNTREPKSPWKSSNHAQTIGSALNLWSVQCRIAQRSFCVFLRLVCQCLRILALRRARRPAQNSTLNGEATSSWCHALCNMPKSPTFSKGRCSQGMIRIAGMCAGGNH